MLKAIKVNKGLNGELTGRASTNDKDKAAIVINIGLEIFGAARK